MLTAMFLFGAMIDPAIGDTSIRVFAHMEDPSCYQESLPTCTQAVAARTTERKQYRRGSRLERRSEASGRSGRVAVER